LEQAATFGARVRGRSLNTNTALKNRHLNTDLESEGSLEKQARRGGQEERGGGLPVKEERGGGGLTRVRERVGEGGGKEARERLQRLLARWEIVPQAQEKKEEEEDKKEAQTGEQEQAAGDDAEEEEEGQGGGGGRSKGARKWLERGVGLLERALALQPHHIASMCALAQVLLVLPL
jgi:hypothetical protein